MGTLRKTKSWPIYFVNGYKFHTSSWGEGQSTYNSGVCVTGVGQDGITSEYYSVLKEIIEFEWSMTSFMKLVLFYCNWFDPSKHGIKVDSQFGIVEVRKRGRYSKFDPFIFPQTATQVYYASHPERKENKADWWVVIKIKPRGTVDTRYNLEVAYQEEQSCFTIVNKNERDIIEEGDEDISNEEEVGDEETSSEEANDEEEETSEEEDFLDSDDSASHFHIQDEEEDKYEED
ncbi:putative extensin-like [Capsicum annuum]|nr:putative extensin-like [Capsicum annuum]